MIKASVYKAKKHMKSISAYLQAKGGILKGMSANKVMEADPTIVLAPPPASRSIRHVR